MAQKKITELQLIGSLTDDVNVPGDDGVQTYRFTLPQLYTYLRPLMKPLITEIANLQINATCAGNALTIAVKTQAGTDASSTDKIRVAMRSATLTSGGFNLREISGVVSLVISSGSTLGQVSGQPSNIYVYLIDNAGTLELAASHKYYPDDALVSTTAEGGAGAADSATAIYSTTARSSVPVRLIGVLTNTQATAGTWATAPSQIQLATPLSKKTPTLQVFTSGSGTYYTPAGVKFIRVRMVAGGGGGAGGGTASWGAGGDGGDTTFGSSLLTCTKGTGAPTPASSGGVGGGAAINSPAVGFSMTGGNGSSAMANTAAAIAGLGGVSAFGGAGTSTFSTGSAGRTNSGSGGGGGYGGVGAGGYGGSGGGAGGFIDAIIADPAASYAYAVGSAGSGGSAGTSGGIGGAGAAGIIIVEEYY